MKTCEELLGELLEHFHINGNGNLEWIYIEDTTVAEISSKEFEDSLINFKLDYEISNS